MDLLWELPQVQGGLELYDPAPLAIASWSQSLKDMEWWQAPDRSGWTGKWYKLRTEAAIFNHGPGDAEKSDLWKETQMEQSEAGMWVAQTWDDPVPPRSNMVSDVLPIPDSSPFWGSAIISAFIFF